VGRTGVDGGWRWGCSRRGMGCGAVLRQENYNALGWIVGGGVTTGGIIMVTGKCVGVKDGEVRPPISPSASWEER